MSNRRGLGRGLSAIIPSIAQEPSQEEHLVPISQIQRNPDQPRTEIDEESLLELTDSIKKVGVLQPIIVRPFGEGYQIVAGERRWRAARAAELEKVPVRVLGVSDGESLEIALIENLQREDLNAIEEARGYRRLLTEHQMTQAELADKVSKSRSAVTNALRLLDLPEEIQELVYAGKVSAGHARAILSIPDEQLRIRLAEKVVAEGLSVRETENLARLYAAGKGEKSTRPVMPKLYKVVTRRLRRVLGTGVRIKQSSGRSRLEIEFHGEEDLERIFHIINSDLDGHTQREA